MSNVIPMFTFNGTQLRGVMIDGQPWFVSIDAVTCVGLCPTHNHVHVRKLDKDEVQVVARHQHPVLFTGSAAPRITIISRPGLFKLSQRSNKPEAREFDRWVRHEVLPQIMDTGGYMTPSHLWITMGAGCMTPAASMRGWGSDGTSLHGSGRRSATTISGRALTIAPFRAIGLTARQAGPARTT